MRVAPSASSSCSMANRLRAASCRSPRGRQVAHRAVDRRRARSRDRPRRAARLGIEPQRRVGRIVADQHARRGDGRIGCGSCDRARRAPPRSRRAPWPRRATAPAASPSTADDRRFHPGRAWPAIEHRHRAAKAVAHLVGGGRRQPARGIGGWRRQRPARRPRSAPAPADGRGCGCATVSSPAVTISARPLPGRAGSTSVSGPGQSARQPARQRRELGQRLGHRQVGAMDDQRIEARPPLGLVDRQHRIGVGRVGAQAIDRLGGKGARACRRAAGRRRRPPICRIDRARCTVMGAV